MHLFMVNSQRPRIYFLDRFVRVGSRLVYSIRQTRIGICHSREHGCDCCCDNCFSWL